MEKRVASISAGHYTLTRWDDGDFWLNNDETGEGMSVSEQAVLETFEALWEEF